MGRLRHVLARALPRPAAVASARIGHARPLLRVGRRSIFGGPDELEVSRRGPYGGGIGLAARRECDDRVELAARRAAEGEPPDGARDPARRRVVVG